MSDIIIYDSEGQPLDQSRQENESIRDYFFNGVRFAADVSGYHAEVICFFRARESAASRAEQYYATYSADNLDNFEDDLRRQIEEYGLSLDTSTKDAGVFELVLGDSTSATFPGTQKQLSDLKKLYRPAQSEVSNHTTGPQDAADHSPQNVSVDTRDIPTEQITVGVGTYQQVVGAVKKLRSELGIESFAIADNVTGGDLQNYELVVQKGNYTGMEFIGNTQTAVNTLQTRREKIHQQLYGDDSDSLFNLSTSQGITATLSVSIFAGLVLITFALYGAHIVGGVCLFNLPGLDDCTTGQPTIENVTINGKPIEDVDMLNRSDKVDIQLNLSQSVSDSSVEYSFGDQLERKNATGKIINFTDQNPPVEAKNHTFRISIDNDSREKKIMIDGPQFVIENLIVDDEITAGDSVNLNVTVQNTGTMNGTGSLQYTLTQHNDGYKQNKSINLTVNKTESIQRSLQINTTTRQLQGEQGYNLTVTVENGRYSASQSREIQIRNLISLERFEVNGTTQDELVAQESENFEVVQNKDFDVGITLTNNREGSRLNASVEYVLEPVGQNNDSVKKIEINDSPLTIEFDALTERDSFDDISLSEIGRYNQSLIISINDSRPPIIYNIDSNLLVGTSSSVEENTAQQDTRAELGLYRIAYS